jgi:hypothetical protein
MMPYAKTIVCLANSFKTGGICVAGKEKLANGGYGDWIRPVSDRPGAELSRSECINGNYGEPKLLDIIAVPLLEPLPHGHQTENHLIDGTRRWSKLGVMPWTVLPQICDRPPSLWINGGSTRSGGLNNCIGAVHAATLRSSLSLVRPETFSIAVGWQSVQGLDRKVCWGKFTYNTEEYVLKLTHPDVSKAFQPKEEGDYPLEDVYICVSLTEPFSGDGKCHKLVAAILSKRKLG